MMPEDLEKLASPDEIEGLRDLWQKLGTLPETQPSPALRAQFYQKLNAAVRGESQREVAWWKRPLVWQLGVASLIFLMGIGVGRVRTQRDAPPPSDVSELRSEVQGLRQTVALSLMQKPSASSRLQGVEWSSQVARPDEELISALLSTLNSDQNINVRLAALDALEKFTSDATVRKSLEQSITKQESPLIQIALIDALVHIRDHSAAAEFKQLSGNSAVDEVVRRRAQWAVEKLSLN